ncbi:MAG: hypothetical protein ACREAN_03570, partial [Nitrosopumilaceae archaeon]
GRRNPVFSISLRAQSEKPFVVELFQTYLGFPITRLTPYATFVRRWKNDFQTLTIEAVIATRLAFRPPERITPLNADRLNRFIDSVARKVDWSKVDAFVKDFQLEQSIEENLKQLQERHNLKIKDSGKLSFLSR